MKPRSITANRDLRLSRVATFAASVPGFTLGELLAWLQQNHPAMVAKEPQRWGLRDLCMELQSKGLVRRINPGVFETVRKT